MGHVYRMLRLAMALRKRGHIVTMVTLADSAGESLFRDAGLKCRSLSARDDHRGFQNHVGELQPALVAIDMLDALPAHYHALRTACACPVVAFDDRGPAGVLADVVINSIAFIAGPPNDSCRLVYEGPEYMILAPEFAQTPPLRTRDKVQHVFIGFGGSDTHNITARALRILETVSRPLQIVVNFGPASESDDDIQEIIDASHHAIRLTRNPDSLIRLFDEADLAFCAGGIMIYELAARGCPVVAIAAEHHERATIGYWAAQGTALDLGWERELDIAAASKTLRRLIDDIDGLDHMRRTGPTMIDSQGSQRCVDIIEALLA
jgi:spore coat polysaccharide biosynthesis predicted glycosyltransferase SpsG